MIQDQKRETVEPKSNFLLMEKYAVINEMSDANEVLVLFKLDGVLQRLTAGDN